MIDNRSTFVKIKEDIANFFQSIKNRYFTSNNEQEPFITELEISIPLEESSLIQSENPVPLTASISVINSPFFEKSKEIANDFLQSIVFLDDRAYSEKSEDNRDFDAFEISKSFAREQKICAVYKPTSKADIGNFKLIANKADVVVLDWEINFPLEFDPKDSEADAPNDEPRGQYTKEIIKDMVSIDNNDLKLIIIYTGDYTILQQITEDIYKESLNEDTIYEFDSDNYTIESGNIKIIVRAKEVTINHAENLHTYSGKIVKHDELPSFILEEYTKMTAGLLSNFALLSLSTIRKNSHKILSLFSKELDSAYMAHKSLLPNQDDSESLLIELFGDSMSDLLNYQLIDSKIQKELIENWINYRIIDEQFDIQPNKNFQRNKDLLIKLISSREENIEKRIVGIFADTSLTNNEKKQFLLKCTQLFLNLDEHSNLENIDKEFAKLTHHKSLFLPQSMQPKLTLGTIIKSMKNDNSYFICIQQKCDSVRIRKDEERKFLFLPFNKVEDGKFDVITPNGVKLRRDRNSFSIKTIKFICSNEDGVIKGDLSNDGRYIYTQKYTTNEDEQFEWVLDLKDLHSQRIVTDYASVLSRVGLDESEWLRRSSS